MTDNVLVSCLVLSITLINQLAMLVCIAFLHEEILQYNCSYSAAILQLLRTKYNSRLQLLHFYCSFKTTFFFCKGNAVCLYLRE